MGGIFFPLVISSALWLGTGNHWAKEVKFDLPNAKIKSLNNKLYGNIHEKGWLL